MRPFVAVASAFFLMPLLAGVPAQAALTVTESFKSTANKDSSDMVWNTALGELHPPLVVKSYNDQGVSGDFNFSVGDGRHGDFVSAADYAALSCASVSGSVIVIDTDQCPNLQFKNFRLLSGWTLRPKGSRPLVIRSLSDVWVEGTIDCSGGDGEDGGASVAAASAGGTGRCGGGDGGASVLPGVAAGIANTGEAGGSLVLGGDGGGLQGASGGEGGGGGGAYVKDFDNPGDSPDGTDGVDTAGVGVGNVGTNSRDDDFMDDLSGAGSGGGGGSGFDLGTPSENSSGGGGGAGGGNIQIYAVGDVTVEGAILANGGKGGSVTSTYLAGGGGGGGGGSILIMTVGEIENDGVISAANGLGGTAASSANGGDGYWGRTWVVDNTVYANGNVESPETTLSSPGNVYYETGLTYTVTSKPIDLGNSAPEILNAEATVQGTGSFTLNFQVAFGESADDVALNNFAAVSSYVGKKVGPYARFQISLDNQNVADPARVTMVEFEFDGHVQEEFNFVGACGGIAGAGLGLGFGGGGGGGSGNGFVGGVAMASWLALLLLPFSFLLGLRLKGTRLFTR